MALDTLKNIRIKGIVCCVPDNVMETEVLDPFLGEKETRKFRKVTGVKKRHVSEEDNVITAGDLCYAAANHLLDTLEVKRETIDAVIFVTQSSDYTIPATACVLQDRLGLSEEAIAYDINLGCSGYIYGLHVAATYLQSGHIRKVLLLAGEADVVHAPVARRINGEAGSATLVEYDENGYDMSFLLKTMGSGFRNIIDPYGRYRHGKNPALLEGKTGEDVYSNRMDGIEVFKFGALQATKLTKEYMELVGKAVDEFDLFAYHQSNKMILEEIASKVGIDRKKCPISLDLYGNTSSASVPLAICDYFNRLQCEEKSDEEKHIVTCGYGIGLSLGVTSFAISGNLCFPVITTDAAWEDNVL